MPVNYYYGLLLLLLLVERDGTVISCNCYESVQQFFSGSYFSVASVLQCLKLCSSAEFSSEGGSHNV